MEDSRFIETIRLENILSYGPGHEPLKLEPLNVLIGPNASGKSNLMEALSLLQAAPRDLQEPIRIGGGVGDWVWKGRGSADATIDATIKYHQNSMPLRYLLSFNDTGIFVLKDEVVEDEKSRGANETQPLVYYRYGIPQSQLRVAGNIRRIALGDLSIQQSILSQRRDPDSYPQLTFLARQFERMKFYREWNTGRSTPLRLAQRPDLPQDFLLEDGSNLALVLSDLLNQPLVKARILERMRDFYPRFRDVSLHVSAGSVQIFFHEQGLHHSVPATRLSDGSLRYLCLLAVLCHPNPPPVICIEEPEIGLHPDIIPEVAKLLVEASSVTQLFVTTHSDVLVDALTDTPESVIVCENLDGGTQLRRLDSEELAPWLDDYRLGQLWSSGEIGGNRW